MMMDNWMTGYGLTHWLLLVVMVAVVLYPLGRILRRLGLSPFWSVLVFIPLVNLVSLYQAGRLKLNELAARTYPLTAINDALAALASSEGARGIIQW